MSIEKNALRHELILAVPPPAELLLLSTVPFDSVLDKTLASSPHWFALRGHSLALLEGESGVIPVAILIESLVKSVDDHVGTFVRGRMSQSRFAQQSVSTLQRSTKITRIRSRTSMAVGLSVAFCAIILRISRRSSGTPRNICSTWRSLSSLSNVIHASILSGSLWKDVSFRARLLLDNAELTRVVRNLTKSLVLPFTMNVTMSRKTQASE